MPKDKEWLHAQVPREDYLKITADVQLLKEAGAIKTWADVLLPAVQNFLKEALAALPPQSTMDRDKRRAATDKAKAVKEAKEVKPAPKPAKSTTKAPKPTEATPAPVTEEPPPAPAPASKRKAKGKTLTELNKDKPQDGGVLTNGGLLTGGATIDLSKIGTKRPKTTTESESSVTPDAQAELNAIANTSDTK